jgi:hypothetical protein
MAVKPKGLLGQYAGFVTRAIGLVTDVLIVIGVIAVINGSIALILELFLDVQVAACPAVEWQFDWRACCQARFCVMLPTGCASL